MVTKGDKIAFAMVLLLAVGAFFFFRNSNYANAAVPDDQKDGKGKKGKKESKGHSKGEGAAADGNIVIQQKWEMPKSLNEISGISWIGNGRFACVQDEEGKIFIYSTTSGNVEREIAFGAAGDYEAIAHVGTTAYVMRSDGVIFEVSGYAGTKPAVKQYSTHLTARQDVEGLCYDARNNRLLLAIKGRELDSKDFKGIYAFDLKSKSLAAVPVYKVDMTGAGGAGKGNKLQPSDIAIHPATRELYILDGPNSRLLVMGEDGKTRNLYQLNTKDFAQPEGIDFTPEGELYISNEANKAAGNILKVGISPAN